MADMRSQTTTKHRTSRQAQAHRPQQQLCLLNALVVVIAITVVRWLFGCGLVGLLVVLIVPLFLSFLALQHSFQSCLCCYLCVTLTVTALLYVPDTTVTKSSTSLFHIQQLCN